MLTEFMFMAKIYMILQNFSPNPYFEDTKLTKTITFLDEGTTKITATSIKWKEGMVTATLYFFYFYVNQYAI